LQASTLAAAAAGYAAAGTASTQAPATPEHKPTPTLIGGKDPYAIAVRFRKFLRVTDVTDGLDAVGRADLTLMDPSIRPLWMGMSFWGPAVTMRIIPTNRRMPVIDKKDALRQHDIWGDMGGWHTHLPARLTRDCVIVTSTNGAKECGYWGSNNSLDMMSRGVAGIVT